MTGLGSVCSIDKLVPWSQDHEENSAPSMPDYSKSSSEVAYRLRLPPGARIHDVFHVGVLKPFHGTPPTITPALPPLQHGRMLQQPEKVFKSKLRRGTWHILVKWSGFPESEATWEPVPEFQATYPDYQLEDELFPEDGRDVMVGQVYQRRTRERG